MDVAHVNHVPNVVPPVAEFWIPNVLLATMDTTELEQVIVYAVHLSARNATTSVTDQYVPHAHSIVSFQKDLPLVNVIFHSFAIVSLACALNDAGGEKLQ